MAKYTFIKEDMPHYRQLMGACGLTAVLQGIRPNLDPIAKTIITKNVEKCLSLFPGLSRFMKDENTRHQYAVAYIILKAAHNDVIGNFLKSYDEMNYEFIQDVISFELQKRMKGKSEEFSKSLEKQLKQYIEKDKLNKVFLHEYTTRIKTDVELKLLMAIFGYKFLRFPYSADGTGAINFELIDDIIKSGMIKDESLNNYDEIFEFMLTFLEVQFPKCITLINTGFHWVTANKLILTDGKRIPDLFYLDPAASSKPVKLSRWKKSKWFYLFQYDEKLRDEITPIVETLFNIRVKIF